MTKKPCTWLITGAAGFIGSNFSRYVLERGDRVVALDNLSSGQRTTIDRLELYGGSRFRFIKGDIRDAEAVNQAAAGCHFTVHLAALVSVQQSLADPELTISINVEGFLKVYEASVTCGVERFVYASSSAVYGDATADQMPIKETTPLNPLSPYASSKLANEQDARELAIRHPGMKSVGLRFFNVFGAGQNPNGDYAAVIPKWISTMRENKAPVIFGDGSATRDFCHVDNICALISSLCRRTQFPAGEVFNVGTATATCLSDLYDVIRSEKKNAGHKGWSGPPEHLPWRAGDIYHSVADTKLAKIRLGFSPLVDLRVGINRLLTQDAERFPSSVEEA